MKKFNLIKRSTLMAVIMPAVVLSFAAVNSAQAETSKYRFSDQYKESRQARIESHQSISILTEAAKFNKKNRNGKSKNRFSEKQKNKFGGYGSSKLV